MTRSGSWRGSRQDRRAAFASEIGGWIYAPWRGTFYPKGLKQADELSYAASHLTSIEINATHYRLQSPASFRKWADAAPDGFKFSVKGPRLVTQQKVLAETGSFIKRFIASGLGELGDKLGPVLWQFAPFKKFDREDFAKFLGHLPRELDGQKLMSCGRGAPRELRHAGIHHAAARRRRRRRLHRGRGFSVHRRSHRATSSMPGCREATILCPPPIRRRSWINGRSVRASGPKAERAGRPSRSSMRPQASRRSRATCSSISSMRESCARPPPPWL